jgi:hypothetical protein
LQGIFQKEIEVQGFDTTKKLLEGCEMRNSGETQYCPDTIHLFKIPDDGAIIFFSILFEKK